MAHVMLLNPRTRDARGRFIKGHKAKSGKRRHSVKANPSHRKGARRSHHAKGRRHVRRNPSMRGFFASTMRPALWGTAGAIGTGLTIGYLPINATYKTGNIGLLLKVGVGLAEGLALHAMEVTGGSEYAAGAVIASTYDWAKEMAAVHAPNLQLAGGFGAYTPAPSAIGPGSRNPINPGALAGPGMGAYTAPTVASPITMV